MNFVDIILKKKAGMELTREEIAAFAYGAAWGTVPDYQLSALLMAIYLALDGYGPACNVTGDGAIALGVDRFFRK